MTCRARALTLLTTSILLGLAACDDGGRVTVTPHVAPPAATQPASEIALQPTASPAAETSVSIAESTHTLTGVNLRLADLICVAYRTPENRRALVPLLSAHRVISREPLPAERYDVRVHVPNGSAPRLRAALRKTLADSFGITARREMRETTALVLTGPTGRIKTANQPSAADANTVTLTGTELPLLAEQLEERLAQPVLDETGLSGPYTLRVPLTVAAGQAQAPNGQAQSPAGQSQQLDVDTVRRAVREQLGLELTPARRSVEYLVVERAAPPQARNP